MPFSSALQGGGLCHAYCVKLQALWLDKVRCVCSQRNPLFGKGARAVPANIVALSHGGNPAGAFMYACCV